MFTEVRVLLQYQCSPREVHLVAVYRIFWYLKCNVKKAVGLIVFDIDIPYISQGLFIAYDQQIWKQFYLEAEESITSNAPEPKGKPVKVSLYIDANHAGNFLTGQSHTGIIIYINNSPITWFRKWQNTVETSSLGYDLIELKIAN